MKQPLVTRDWTDVNRKVTASSLAALGGSFLVDVIEPAWAAMPDTFEPFVIAALVFLAGYIVKERKPA